jgi:hypothetical protein
MAQFKSKLNPYNGQLQIVPTNVVIAFKAGVAAYANLPIAANAIGDARIANDTGVLYVWSIDATAGQLTDWVSSGDIVDLAWAAISGRPNSTVANIDDAVTKRHTNNLDHATGSDNQTADTVPTDDSGVSVQDALDSKTTLSAVKADVDVADAISKKHSNSLDHAQNTDTTLGTLTSDVAVSKVTPKVTLTDTTNGYLADAKKDEDEYLLRNQVGMTAITYTSQYPPAFTTDYAKATTTSSANIAEGFDPSLSVLGTGWGAGVALWQSGGGDAGRLNNRVHVDLGSAKTIKRLMYSNFHYEGGYTGRSVKNVILQGSNTESDFLDTVYANNGTWVTIASYVFLEHAAADSADWQYQLVTNTTAYRYYAFKFADNYGDANFTAFRRIELQTSVPAAPVYSDVVKSEAVGNTYGDDTLPTVIKGSSISGLVADDLATDQSGMTVQDYIDELDPLSHTQNTDTNLPITAVPAGSYSAQGIKTVLTASETMLFGDVGYLNVAGEVVKCDASAIATANATVICVDNSITINTTGNFLLVGTVKNVNWFWSPGGLIYLAVDKSAEEPMSQVAPTETDEVVQILGVATSTNSILFNPQLTQIELS